MKTEKKIQFAHYEDGGGNTISTSQAYYAIAVMYESKNGTADKPTFEELSTVNEPSETVSQNSVESDTDNADSNSNNSVSNNADNTSNGNTNNNAGNSVATGDSENIILLFGAGMISASVILALAKKKKED